MPILFDVFPSRSLYCRIFLMIFTYENFYLKLYIKLNQKYVQGVKYIAYFRKTCYNRSDNVDSFSDHCLHGSFVNGFRESYGVCPDIHDLRCPCRLGLFHLCAIAGLLSLERKKRRVKHDEMRTGEST